MKYSNTQSYITAGGIQIYRASIGVDYLYAADEIVAALDSHPGVMLSSTYEFPGRYARWDIGFANPPLRISSVDRRVKCEALNSRGEVLLHAVHLIFSASEEVADYQVTNTCITFE